MKNPFLKDEDTKKVSIFYILKYLKNHKIHLTINVLLSLIMAGFSIAIPFLTKEITKSAVNTD